MRKAIVLCALLFATVPAFGQGMRYDNFVLKPLAAGGVTPVTGALITVCTSAGTGTPCTPKVANIFSDEALTQVITGTGGAGTTNSDSNGNFGFYLAPGSYIVTVTGSGITSYTIKLVAPVGLATVNTFTGLITANAGITTTTLAASGQITSTVATGTPPLVIASTTNVPNLNASSLTGKTAPSGNIVGDTDTQTLTNKTFKTLNTIRFADQFAGADWCAKVNAADTDLGATSGEIWLNQVANTGPCGVSPTLSAMHTLRVIQQGQYRLFNFPLLLNAFSGVICDAGFLDNATRGCIFQYEQTSGYAVAPANSASLTEGAFLKGGMVIIANQNAGGGIDMTNAARWLIEDVLVENDATSTTIGINLFANTPGAYYNRFNRVDVKTFSTCMNIDANTSGNAPNRSTIDNLSCGASRTKDVNITANGGDQHFTHFNSTTLAASGVSFTSASASSTLVDGYWDVPGATATAISLLSGAIANVFVAVNIGNGFATPCTIASGANANYLIGLGAGPCTDNGSGNYVQNVNNTGTHGAGMQTFETGCNGTATSSQSLNLGISGSGPATCTDTATTAAPFVAATSGKIQNLRVRVVTGGFNASSGVFTLKKNGSNQSITCTVGTGTSCNDVTHSFFVVAGDVISVIYTTQATETLANISVGFEKQ